MGAKRIPDEVVEQLRSMKLSQALNMLVSHGLVFWRYDAEFVPIKNKVTVRVYVSTPAGAAWELVVTGMRWHDPRAGRGGGGAIDLVQYLVGAGFRETVRLLSVPGPCA